MSKPFDQVRVAVLGSVNLDIVANVERFPQPGETITDASIRRFPGGKGANQALAARRLGAQVCLLACVGRDGMAEEALSNLRREGVDLSRCRVLDGTGTGLALIQVAAHGENQIVVAPGANALFRPQQLDLPSADVLIAQLEVPMDTIEVAATGHAGMFCLNAAPVREVSAAVISRTDLLVVNEIEVTSIQPRLANFQGLLAVTLGAEGAVLYRQGEEVARARPPTVQVTDTTGAGDAFTAALAVGLAAGLAPGEALTLACRAGALTATRPGAQSAPTLAELNQPGD